MMKLRAAVAVFALSVAALSPAQKMQRGEIVWDTFGTPHIFARSTPDMFYGFGYAVAKAHGDLLLHMYAETRGRAAEYFGTEYADSDRYLVANDLMPRAQQWWDQQSPAIKSYLNAYAEGVNAFAKQHPEALAPEVRQVLPVSGLDVMAHWERIMLFQYIASRQKVLGVSSTALGAMRSVDATSQMAYAEPDEDNDGRDSNGSNAWAIAPKKSASGNSMLLINPHLNWAPSWQRYFEVQLEAPGVHLYGATQVGLPVLRFCFNDHHGLTNTVNTLSSTTVYKLTLKNGGYEFDGKVLPFTVTKRSIKIKQPDGTLRTESIDVRHSVHGPVFTRPDGATVALRVPGLDRAFGIEEYWQLDTATSFAAYQKELARLQVPSFNITYADRDGHIEYFFNGYVPVRSHGDYDFWQGLVPGNTSANLWTELHTYDQLPKVVDPPSGWVMNTNNPPWISTALPAIDPQKYPPYMSPNSLILRAQQSMRLLDSKPKLSFEDFTALKHSTRVLMADRMLPELLAAATQSGSKLVQQAVAVLKAWDHNDDKDARGALLFETWGELFAGKSFLGQENYAQRWSFSDPLNTPRGLKDPKKAVAMLEDAAKLTIQRYGAIDRPFGEVSRFHIADVNVPGNGGFGSSGIFRVHTWSAMKDGERTPIHGETIVIATEFGKLRARAQSLISYGESTQPGSKHQGDQLPLLSEKKLKPVWRSRMELKHHTEEITKF